MTGQNNISQARGALLNLYMTVVTGTIDFEDALLELTQQFNAEAQFIHIGIRINLAWDRRFHPNKEADIALVAYAFFGIVIYCIFVLGSCSPIHCRLSATIAGIIALLLSVAGGMGLSAILGF